MGNEKSALNGLDLDEKAVELTDFWMHYGANIVNPNPQRISVFISEPSLHYSASFGKPSPLERIAKNLMLYRHPCILKYISSWQKSSKYYLATELAKPLIQVIDTQTTLQICIGLHSILRALIFLHEKANSSHNNVCSSSIYVTPEGNWKLGGLEYLCKFSEMTLLYFQKIKSYRYEKAIYPAEDVSLLKTLGNLTAIDSYAFGVLAEEIFKLKNADDVPGLKEFKAFCKQNLQNSDASLRKNLSALLQHPFFTHDFIKIHAFLEELPLRNDSEKEIFFTNLVRQLRAFPENIVAEQLGTLLLSRIVLLDCTAQNCLLPYILKPRDENDTQGAGLFSVSAFKTFLVPKLLQIFCIRDASIRLLLLSYFKSFMHVFQTDELQTQILPELLVGIKDTNDYLVSETLKALAEIVLILGATTVIGGNRGKLFTDGRPNKIKIGSENRINNFRKETDINAPLSTGITDVTLPERLSPDGGEDRIETNFTFVEDEWSDWDAQECNSNVQKPAIQVSLPIVHDISRSDNTGAVNPPELESESHKKVETLQKKSNKKLVIADISELDIKHSKPLNSSAEENFFTDMEPVIQKTQILQIEEALTVKSKFEVTLSNNYLEEDDAGWVEDLSDWGTDVNSENKT
ncbi:protein-associating with the carboxyl-terminal domain of ezrin-like [Prorops nasuta]|uniref:protein-associating with the carboxyl-terminal domain of ezrin-like n=1 Tax=Prorops nasuta TaxID=863751 RepID=UPI0034CFECB1